MWNCARKELWRARSVYVGAEKNVGEITVPKFLEKKLKARYGKDSSIPYKIMNAKGLMRGNQETAKGAKMEAKHRADMKKYQGSASNYKHSRPVRKVAKRSFGNA